MEEIFFVICVVLMIVFACKKNWGAFGGWLFATIAQAQVVLFYMGGGY